MPARWVAVVLLALSACPGREPDGARNRAVRGGTLHVALIGDVDLDPQRAGRPVEWFFARALHRGLMAFPNAAHPEGSRPVPDLAEAQPWVAPDRLEYRFVLRSGIHFGPPANRPVRAADVRAGIERLLRAQGPSSEYFEVIEGAADVRAGRASSLAGIETPDERTVVVRLTRPANDLLWLLALPQASAVPEELAAATRLAASEIAPSGPYRIAAYDPERSLALERNPVWVARADPIRAANVDRIQARIGVDPKQIASLLDAGDVDLAPDALVARTTADLARGTGPPRLCLRYLWMNTSVAPFDDLRVRRAVSLALDRRAIAAVPAESSPLAAEGAIAEGILPPAVFGSAETPGGGTPSNSAPALPDPAGARALLAGFRRPPTVRLVVGDRREDRGQAEQVRRALSAAGIRVDVRSVPLALLHPDWYERPARKTPMGIATWCADWPGLAGRSAIGALLDGRRIRATGNTVFSMMRSASLERAIDSASAVTDEAGADGAGAAEVWAAVDRAAMGLAAVVPLMWTGGEARVGARVRGLVATPFFPAGDPANVWLPAPRASGTLGAARGRGSPVSPG